MRRNILTWHILNETLIGTHHIPAESNNDNGDQSHRIGVLLINSGPAPRSGNSDLPVRIGDRLASRGIPVFRFDLPGLGDSTGSTPSEFNNYWLEVLQGRNDAATMALIERLKEQFNLSDIIIGGLCAAAVPTLSVAANLAIPVAGVILMEPAVRFGSEIIPNFSQSNLTPATPIGGQTKLAKLLSIRNWLRFLTGDNRVATTLRPLRPYLVRIQLMLFGHTLHGDMNVPLFMHWRNIHSRGTHSFVAVAEGNDMDRCVTHILDSLPAKAPGQVTLIRIPQTNHILTSGDARDIILDALELWCISKCKL
jgi:pimeloyl-ACP methyl ester carboxylesterase